MMMDILGVTAAEMNASIAVAGLWPGPGSQAQGIGTPAFYSVCAPLGWALAMGLVIGDWEEGPEVERGEGGEC